jgi:hypothetical protein
MTHEEKLSLLKEEYFILLKFYEDFDARFLTIKGWSTTVGAAAIGLGIQYAKPFLFLFGAGVAFLFWILEAMWKGLQHSYRSRISAIEGAFQIDQFDKITPLQAHTSWTNSWSKGLRLFFRNVFRPIVVLPHAITALAGIAMYAYWSSPAVAGKTALSSVVAAPPKQTCAQHHTDLRPRPFKDPN